VYHFVGPNAADDPQAFRNSIEVYVETLDDMPLLETVLDMQRALSTSGDEAELVYNFAVRFRELVQATEVLDVAVVDAAERTYRVMDRVWLRNPDLSPSSIRRQTAWNVSEDRLPVYQGGFVGSLLGDDWPKLVRDIEPDVDDVLASWIDGPRDALAVPIFVEGRVQEWLMLFRPPGLPLDALQIRTSVSLLNMLSRGAYQIKLTQQIAALHAELESKLNEVARVQQSILPSSLPAVPACEIAVRYRPSDVAGGDFYEFREFGDGSIGIVIADVAGHGPAAAVVMAMLRTAMSIYRRLDMPGNEVVRIINDFMWDGLRDGTFVTAFFLRVDPKSGDVTYANAGHMPAIVRRHDGTIDRLDAEGSVPIGVIPEVESAGGDATLEPGDIIVMYTDGVSDAFSAERELFGEARLKAAIRDAPFDPDGVLDAILTAVDEHSPRNVHADDQCLLAVKYVGMPADTPTIDPSRSAVPMKTPAS